MPTNLLIVVLFGQDPDIKKLHTCKWSTNEDGNGSTWDAGASKALLEECNHIKALRLNDKELGWPLYGKARDLVKASHGIGNGQPPKKKRKTNKNGGGDDQNQADAPKVWVDINDEDFDTLSDIDQDEVQQQEQV